MSRKRYTSKAIKIERSEKLKNNLIPKDKEKIRRLQALLTIEYKKLRIHRNELHNMMADLRTSFDSPTYIDNLKEESTKGKPKGIKIPKSIGGTGK